MTVNRNQEQCLPNTALELRRRRSPKGEREAAASTPTLPERPPRGAVSSKRSFDGTAAALMQAFVSPAGVEAAPLRIVHIPLAQDRREAPHYG